MTRSSNECIGDFVGFSLDNQSTQESRGYNGLVHEVNGKWCVLKVSDWSPICQLVCNSRAGTAAFLGAGFGATVGGMYFAHRMESGRHHRMWHLVERLVPVGVGAMEGVADVHNYRLIDYDKKAARGER